MHNITKATLALIQEQSGYFNTRIIQGNRQRVSKYSAEEILKHNCRQYGSSYPGRLEFSKGVLKNNTKLPIPVLPEKGVFLFPTTSPKNAECVWISYYNIKDYRRYDSFTRVRFHNGVIKLINVSFYQFDSQMNRMSRVIAQYHYPFYNNEEEE